MPDMTGHVQAGGFTTSEAYGSGAPTGQPPAQPFGYFRHIDGNGFNVWPTGGSAWLVALSNAPTAAGVTFVGATASAASYTSGGAVASGTATLAITNAGAVPFTVVELYVDTFSAQVNGAGGVSHPTLTIDLDDGSGTLVATGLAFGRPMPASADFREEVIASVRRLLGAAVIAPGGTVTYRARLWVGSAGANNLVSATASPRLRAYVAG